MEKRTSPLTVMLEPSLHDLLRRRYDNVSQAVHDLIVQHLLASGEDTLGAHTPPDVSKM